MNMEVLDGYNARYNDYLKYKSIIRITGKLSRKEVYQIIGTPLLCIVAFVCLMLSKRREDNPS